MPITATRHPIHFVFVLERGFRNGAIYGSLKCKMAKEWNGRLGEVDEKITRDLFIELSGITMCIHRDCPIPYVYKLQTTTAQVAQHNGLGIVRDNGKSWTFCSGARVYRSIHFFPRTMREWNFLETHCLGPRLFHSFQLTSPADNAMHTRWRKSGHLCSFISLTNGVSRQCKLS